MRIQKHNSYTPISKFSNNIKCVFFAYGTVSGQWVK